MSENISHPVRIPAEVDASRSIRLRGGAREQSEEQCELVQEFVREGCVTEDHDPTMLSYRSRIEEVRRRGHAIDEKDTLACVAYRRELAEAQANYGGDWTLLELRRVLDTTTYEKYRALVNAATDLKEDGSHVLTKKTDTRAFYEQLANPEDYKLHVARVFMETRTEPSSVYGKRAENVGRGEYGTPGVVFSNATHGGETLNDRHKNIVEAHEKIHGLYTFGASLGSRLCATLDPEVSVEQGTYLRQPDEILARMSQLRNYFGLGANDAFTSEHLEIAKQRYVRDTGFDNDMSAFLSCITEKTRGAFIREMNAFPM